METNDQETKQETGAKTADRNTSKRTSHFQRLQSKPDLSHYSDEQKDIAKDLDGKETQTLLVSELDKPITDSEVRKQLNC